MQTTQCRRLGAVLAFGVLAGQAGAASAGEIYKSVDANGNVVYTDQVNSSGTEQSTVTIQPTAIASEEGMRASDAPPPLPADEPPPFPGEGYLWTPGYWAWGPAGYFWVPGAWVLPPQPGVLWTPGYWIFLSNVYVFHSGYWAERVGFYGGINYGHGYVGSGYYGGRWIGRTFAYNLAVYRINPERVHSTYTENVNAPVSRVSFNGGPGGVSAVPSAEQKAVASLAHLPPTTVQRQTYAIAVRTPVPVAVAHHSNSVLAPVSPRQAPGGIGPVQGRSPLASTTTRSEPNAPARSLAQRRAAAVMHVHSAPVAPAHTAPLSTAHASAVHPHLSLR